MAVDASKVDNINNFTAASKAQSSKNAAATNALFSNYEQFVKLLTVQLENQDPTKPLETNEMTNQIAQLSQVEQSLNTNKYLETLISLFSTNQFAGTVGYIGKFVEAPGNYISLQSGRAIGVYSLEAEADSVKISVSDRDGNIVYQGDGTKLAGRNEWVWDGKRNNGLQAEDGTYAISVTAKDIAGKEVGSSTSSSGRVTSLETIEGINYLAMGDILVTMDKVLSVKEMPRQL